MDADKSQSSGKILYCHCAQAQVVPAAVKDAVLQALASSGAEFRAVPDLCEMAARRDPTLKDIAACDSVRIAACYPRAVRWLFAAAGAPLASEGVVILNMRVESADVIVAALAGPAAVQGETVPPPEVAPAGQWKAWFPVIDYTRCTHCMQCLSFCLFDVFAVSPDSRLTVRNPTNCKTECPACSRVCPEVAIVFPKYHHGPIHGGEISPEDLRREAIKVDVSALLGGDVYQALRDRSARSRSRFSKERDEDRALNERRRCLAQLGRQLDIPPEVLKSLPSAEEIRKRAEAAAARAREHSSLTPPDRPRS